MITTCRASGEPLARAVRWVSTLGVEVVAATRPDPVGHLPADHPTLYLVADQAPAPRWWGELEDWVRLPADPDEVVDRADRLVARAAAVGASWTYVDEDDVLRAGRQLVPLGPIEAQLVRILLARPGVVVPRAAVEAALWPRGAPADPRALDNRLTRLRRRIAALPLEVHTVRGRGLLLEQTPSSGSRVAASAS